VKRVVVSRSVVQLAAVLLAAIVVVPFLVIVLNSLKNVRESALFALSLPTEWRWDNYRSVLTRAHIGRGFANSFLISAFTVALDCLTAALAAFVIQRRDTRPMRFTYYLFILGLIVPVSIIPTIELMQQLHLHNTYPGIVLYYTATILPFSLFVLTGYLKSLPRELDEAVVLEGGSAWRLFSGVVVPLIMPALVTVTIVVISTVWNDFFGPFYLISDSRKWTIILQVFSFVSQYQTNWGLVFAFMVLVILPVLAIYLALQRSIIEGLTSGSVKG
jgi:raffinose/stachyose/melibiose transport system permease protein